MGEYCTTNVANVEEVHKNKGLWLSFKCVTDVSSGYIPEMDASAEYRVDGVQWYPEMIGQLRWAIQIGGVDI